MGDSNLDLICKETAKQVHSLPKEIDPNEAGQLAQRLRELMLAGACERLEIGDDFLVTLRHP